MRKLMFILMMVFGIGCAAFAKPVTVNRVVHPYDTVTLVYLSYDEDFDWTGITHYESNSIEDNDFFVDLMMDLDMYFDKGVTYKIGIYIYDDNGKITEQRILTLERLTENYFEATWRFKQKVSEVKK